MLLLTCFSWFPEVIFLGDALCKIDSSDPTVISAIIDKYNQQTYWKNHSAYHQLGYLSQLQLFLIDEELYV